MVEKKNKITKGKDPDSPYNYGINQTFEARLQTLTDSWKKKWEGAFDHSQRLLRLCASGYFQKGYGRWHLINLMKRGVSTITSYLCEGNPRVMVESLVPKMKPYAYGRQLILNHLIEKNKFADEVFIPGAIQSMFGAAIARTFYEYDRVVDLDNEKIKIGTPKVGIIDPVDYVGDPSAKTRGDFAFEGDVYRLPTEYAKDLFAGKTKSGKQIADFITPDCKLVTKYSAAEIAAKENFDFNRLSLEEYTTFLDIHLRKDNTLITILPMGKKAVILREVEWKGPDTPYDYLGYFYAPGIPVPVPPAWDWYDLDVTMNIMGRAAREQAESQKNLIVVDPTGKDIAKQVLEKKNMSIILAKNPELVKTLAVGGVNPDNYSWLTWAETEFTKSGTTPDVLRGAGAQAPTLGQEQLIFSNAARIVNNFHTRFSQWMASILNKWSWAVGDSPSTYVQILDTVKIPGVGEYEYPIVFTKGDKVAEFESFVMRVVPYSTQRTSPEIMYQRLFQFMTSWIVPTMALRAEQGTTIDFAVVDRLMADYGGFENFPAWYKSIIPQQQIDVDAVMKTGESKSPGQGNDKFGATLPSRQANLQQQQKRVGFGGERESAAK